MGRKLLLADDSVTIQKVVALTFAAEDMEIITASDGQEAIDKLAETMPDVALLDIFMPYRDGYEVCAHIRQHPSLNHIPIILLVGAFEPFDHDQARAVGANDYLTKPFQSIRQLVNKVNQLLDPPPPVESYQEISSSAWLAAPVLASPAIAENNAPAASASSEITAPETMQVNLADTFDPRTVVTAPLRASATNSLPISRQHGDEGFDDMGIEVTAITYQASADDSDELLEIAPANANLATDFTVPDFAAPPEDFATAAPPALTAPEPLALSANTAPESDLLELSWDETPAPAPVELWDTPALPAEPQPEPELLELSWPDSPVPQAQAAAAADTPQTAYADEPTPTADILSIAPESDQEPLSSALWDTPAPTSIASPVSELPDDLLDLAGPEPSAADDSDPLSLSTDSANATEVLEFADFPATDEVSAPELLDLDEPPHATPPEADLLALDLDEPPHATPPEADLLALDLLDSEFPAPHLAHEPLSLDDARENDTTELLDLDEISYQPTYQTAGDEDLLDIYEPPPAPPVIVAAPEMEPETLPETELAATEAEAEATPAQESWDILELDGPPTAATEPVAMPLVASVPAPPISAESAVAAPPRRLTLDDLAPEVIDAIARRMVELMSERTVQEIAWEIVPDMAELHIKRHLEKRYPQT